MQEVTRAPVRRESHYFDDQPALSIGEVAIAPSNPNILYVGTREGNPRNNASFGNGVYRSTRWTVWNRDVNLAQEVYKAPNPPQGAVFDYFLNGDQKSDVVITIADKSGTVVRTLRNVPKAKGVNRPAWDLRYDGLRQQPSASRRALADEDADAVERAAHQRRSDQIGGQAAGRSARRTGQHRGEWECALPLASSRSS